MSENLVAYLRQKQAPVSAAELAAEVLKLRNVPAASASMLINNLLASESRIARIGDDTYIYQSGPVRKLSAQSWLICCALPERANHWSEWQALACTSHHRGQSSLIGLVEQSESPDWPAALEGLLRRIGAHDQETALLFSGFGNQLSLFRQAAGDLLTSPLQQPLLSLRRLAAALFPEQKITAPEQLSAALGLQAWSEASIGAMSARLVTVWEHLLAALDERGMDSAEGLDRLLTQEEALLDLSDYAFDALFLRSLPLTSGVYLMRDRAGTVIYVGKAKNLSQRVNSYFVPGIAPDAKLETLRRRLYDLEIVVLGSELEALLLEQRLIRGYDPEVNRQVQVLARPHRRKNRYQRIVILPAAGPEWLRLFFLDPAKGLAHFWLPRDYARAGEIPLCSRCWRDTGAEIYPWAHEGERRDEDAPEPRLPEENDNSRPEGEEPAQARSHGLLLSDTTALAMAVQEFFYSRGPARDPAAAEIAYSWLGDQRERIHGIDMRAITSAAETVRLLEYYRLRLADWNEKVIFT